jgi:hypothetical protein
MLKLSGLYLGFTSLFILGLSGLGALEAEAAPDRWDFTSDNGNDGLPSGLGTPNYEMYGIHHGYDSGMDRFYVAIDSNLPLAGIGNTGAGGGNIAYGDMILNFNVGQSFGSISSAANDKVFAVRFAANDKGSTLGLYKNVKTTSVTTDNVGFETLEKYKKAAGANADLGAVSWDYFNENFDENTTSTPILNVIETGDKVADDGFEVLDETALKNLGLSSPKQGSELYGFSFKGSALGLSGQKDFIAHLFAECGNDGMAFHGKFIETSPSTEVPEPSSIAGLVAMGLIFKGCKHKKRAEKSA